LLGVTSIVRALNLRTGLYTKLLDHFHSKRRQARPLSALWAQAVLQLFPGLVSVNGRLVLVGDGIKAPKRGKKMPAVKAPASAIGIKHQARVHHGAFHAGCRLARNTRPRAFSPCRSPCASTKVWYGPIATSAPCSTRCSACSISWLSRLPSTFVADAYYAGRQDGETACSSRANHLVTRVKSNAVAYAPAPRKKGRKTRGRPKTYGKKIKLKSLLANAKSMQQVASPVYGEGNVTLCYRVCICCGVRRAARAVLWSSCIQQGVLHDTSLSAVDIIRLYGLRFKIECSFKQAVRQIGTFAYHFWIEGHDPFALPQRQSVPTSQIGRLPRPCPNAKMRAYHAFIQAGVVAQDSSNISPSLLPSSFGTFVVGSWLRTIRPCIPPSGVRRCKSAAPGTSRISPWVPQKPNSLTKSSPIAKTRKICGFSAWHREQKEGLLSTDGIAVSTIAKYRKPNRPIEAAPLDTSSCDPMRSEMWPDRGMVMNETQEAARTAVKMKFCDTCNVPTA